MTEATQAPLRVAAVGCGVVWRHHLQAVWRLDCHMWRLWSVVSKFPEFMVWHHGLASKFYTKMGTRISQTAGYHPHHNCSLGYPGIAHLVCKTTRLSVARSLALKRAFAKILRHLDLSGQSIHEKVYQKNMEQCPKLRSYVWGMMIHLPGVQG